MPLSIKRFIIINDRLFFFNDNAIFELKSTEGSIIEIARWTGAQIQNLSIIDDKYLVGTEKGIIIFDGGQLPIWTGERTVILSGKFSDDVIGFALNVYKESRRKYLKINKIDKQILVGKVKKLWTMDKIPFFTPYGGVLDEYLMDYVLDLTNVIDSNNNGFDELIIITPGVDSSYILIVSLTEDGKVDISQKELPNYTFKPFYSTGRDLDLDGLNEILLCSNPKEFDVIVSMIKFPMGKVDIQSLIKVNLRDLFNRITEDGEPYCNVGDIDGDKAFEILLFWEEKPSVNDVHSKLYIMSQNFFGERTVFNEPIIDYPVSQLSTYDFDNDGRDELLLLSPLGLSIHKLDLGAKKAVLSKFIPFLDRIYGLKRENEKIIVFGPLMKEPEEKWVLNVLDGRQFSFGITVPKPRKLHLIDDGIFLLTDEGKLVLINGDERKSVRSNVVDIVSIDKTLYIALKTSIFRYDNANLKKIKDGFNNIKAIFASGKRLYLVDKREKDVVIMDALSGDERCILNNLSDVRLVVPLSYNDYEYYAVSTRREIVLFNNVGEVLEKIDGMALEYGKFTIVGDCEAEIETILFLNKGELFLLKPDEPHLINLGVKNWDAIEVVDQCGEEFYVSFQDGIYIADKREVFYQ